MSKLIISPSPHQLGDNSVKKLMYGVLIALIPTLLVSVYFYGLGAIAVILTAVISSFVFEFAITKYLLKRNSTITDGSAILTGLLLAFNLPSNIPLWLVAIGAFVAIGIGKLSFGGLGSNIFNPALVGRVFLLVSFPVQMTTWPKPSPISEKMLAYTDVITGPTALADFAEKSKLVSQLADAKAAGNTDLISEITAKISAISDRLPDTVQMFIGNMGGSLGEVAAIALLIGLIYMLFRKVITWHIPVSILLTAAVFSGILNAVNPDKFADPVFQLLTGGLLLGAIFMATDYVTSPMSKKGMIVYGIGIGFLTIVIRVWGAYPEGVSFAILIMNAFTPIINMYLKPKRFGEKVKK